MNKEILTSVAMVAISAVIIRWYVSRYPGGALAGLF